MASNYSAVMIPPAGKEQTTNLLGRSGTLYVVASNGTITVSSELDCAALIEQGWTVSSLSGN